MERSHNTIHPTKSSHRSRINNKKPKHEVGMAKTRMDEIHNKFAAIGLNVDKEDKEKYFLKPGELRLQIIKWALSELGIAVHESDVTDAVVSYGLCPPSEPGIVLGKCSAEANFEFWERLIYFIKVFQEDKFAPPLNMDIDEFWIELTSNPELKNIVQPKKSKDLTSLNKQPSTPTVTKSVLELQQEKIIEEIKFKQLKEEVQKFTHGNEVKYSKIEQRGKDEKEKLEQQMTAFRKHADSYLMPWIPNKEERTESNELESILPVLAEKVDKLKTICENAIRIQTAVEAIKSIEIKEPSVNEALESFVEHSEI